MSDIADCRSLDELVDVILKALDPPQPEAVRPALIGIARTAQLLGANNFRVAATATLRKRAGEALRALDALVEAYGPLGNNDSFQWVRNHIDLLTQTTTPHPNTNTLQFGLVLMAGDLVAKYSPHAVSTSKDGNIHVIAKSLFEIATGRRATPTQMLDAIWRRFPAK